MIAIKLFRDIEEFELIESESVNDFIKDNIELFHNGFRLYKEQATEATDITEDVKALVDATMSGCDLICLNPAKGPETWIPLIISALVSVAVVLLSPTPKAPDNSERSQSSATNSLGSRENQVNINSRNSDIWGKVSAAVPDLVQLPHFRFENNIETEHFALNLGDGKLLQENIKDGDTPFSFLIDSKYNSWDPFKHPNNGDTPDLVIGGEINRPLNNVSQSKELNPTELLPPNDLDVDNVTWSCTGSGTSGILEAVNGPDGLDLTDYYTVGSVITMSNINYLAPIADQTLYYQGDAGIYPATFQATSGPVDVGDGNALQYVVSAVTTDTITVEIPQDASQIILDAWVAMVDYLVPSNAYNAFNLSSTYFFTYESALLNRPLFEDNALTIPVETVEVLWSTVVGVPFDGTLGPYTVPVDVDTVTVNIVSSSGFYKLDRNNEVIINGSVTFFLEETDSEGVPTGNSITSQNDYNSNSENTTVQAAITVDIDNPYEYARISGRRDDNRDKEDNISNVDQAVWRDLYFTYNVGAVTPDNSTVAQVAIQSNTASQGVKARQVNMDLTRYITPYIGNGSFGPEEAFSTVAEVTIALALDPLNGRLTLDDIDADLFLSVQQQLIEYYGTPEYVEVGYVLDSTKLRFQDSCPLFWNAVNCKAYAQDAVYKVYPDINRTISSKQFTHRNKIVGSDKRDRRFSAKNENDGVELTYRSNKTGAFETIILHVNGVDSVNRLSIELSGAVNEVQAETRAYRELNYIKYSRINLEFEADGIGLLTVPGERVDNVDGTRISKRENNTNTYNIYDGIVQDISGFTVLLSQPVTFTPNETHSIRFTDKYGNLLEAISCTAGSTPYHVILSTLPSDPIYVGYKREKTTFTFASDNSRESLPMLVLDIQAKNSSGLKTRTIRGINYSSKYYENDKMFSTN